MFKKDIFPTYKNFSGMQFFLSFNNPSALEYCTKEKAEEIAKNDRKREYMARVIKKQYASIDGHSRVAYVVYVRKERV
jgi:hypothetical protein